MFCNMLIVLELYLVILVTILVLLDYVLQYNIEVYNNDELVVTILVLLDYVLQYDGRILRFGRLNCHNPCFIRLCFTIGEIIMFGKKK